MVIEHVFVTTLEATDALRMASEFLAAGGFTPTLDGAFQLGGGWNGIEMSRGKKNPARAKSIEELPQRLRMEWDRGRVTVAASIQAVPHNVFTFGAGAEPPPHSPKVRLHADLMAAISQGLELLLAYQRPPEEARAPWATVANAIEQDARRRRRRSRITVIAVIAFFVLLIGLAIFANTR